MLGEKTKLIFNRLTAVVMRPTSVALFAFSKPWWIDYKSFWLLKKNPSDYYLKYMHKIFKYPFSLWLQSDVFKSRLLQESLSYLKQSKSYVSSERRKIFINAKQAACMLSKKISKGHLNLFYILIIPLPMWHQAPVRAWPASACSWKLPLSSSSFWPLPFLSPALGPLPSPGASCRRTEIH